jgi:hypothetical protein
MRPIDSDVKIPVTIPMKLKNVPSMELPSPVDDDDDENVSVVADEMYRWMESIRGGMADDDVLMTSCERNTLDG